MAELSLSEFLKLGKEHDPFAYVTEKSIFSFVDGAVEIKKWRLI